MTANSYRLAVLILLFLLSACGGSGGSTSENPTTRQMGGAIQGKGLSLSASVSTLAGASTGTDGVGAAARFVAPAGITTDGTSVFVTDIDNTIRRIEIATGAVTTLAGTPGVDGSADGTGKAASFHRLRGIVAVGGNLYVVDSQTIRKIEIATGVVTTFAGNPGSSGVLADGIGVAATFNIPTEITTDGTNLFVVDGYGHKVRKVTIATAEVTTLAATFGDFFSGIAAAGSALYAANLVSISKVDIVTGALSDLSIDTGTSPSIVYPSGMISDGVSIYFTERSGSTVRKVEIASGVVTTLAGSSGTTRAVDGIGAAAAFRFPKGIASDGINLYVIDDHAIRKVVIASGTVTTLAGSTSVTDDGAGAEALFDWPSDIATDGENLFVADGSTIRKVTIGTGAVTTLAGSDGVGSRDGIASAATFGWATFITTDGKNLYVSDSSNYTIRKIVIATGVVSTLAGSAGVSGFADGTGAAASFLWPSGITTDGTYLFVSDRFSNTIRKIEIATGVVTTLAGSPGVTGSTDGTGAAAAFSGPIGIITDGGNLFVVDQGNHSVRKIVIATGVVTTLAGSAFGQTDGIGPTASFLFPAGITTDGTYLYVTDAYCVRKIEIATGVVTTLAGGDGPASVDGTGAAARFYSPGGITTNGRSLFVADYTTIRMIQ